MIAGPFNHLRSEAGLGPVRRIFSRWVSEGDRVIGLWPEWFAGPQGGWPERLVLTGFLNYERSSLEGGDGPPAGGGSDAPLPDGRAEEPAVVFTCGSAMTHARDFCEVAAGVRRILGRRVLVVTDQPMETKGAPARGVEHAPYTPFRRLLPRAAALVHHGGVGTCSAALAAGIPQVIVPMAFDHFDNAARCARLGVARKIGRRRFRPPAVASALRVLLGSEGVAERCRSWAARIDPQAALDRASEAVEELVAPAG